MNNEVKNKEKEKGMIKKFIKKIFRNKDKEIKDNLDEVILKELDNFNYALDKSLDISNEDAERLKQLIETKNSSKRQTWETVKTVSQVLGVTIGAAASIVGIIYTIKGYNFDCKWMELVFNMKDSTDVVDPNSRMNLGKNRDNHRKMIEHMMNKKIG